MEISSTYTGEVYDADTTASVTSAAKDELGQDQFLKMFMAQLTHQDPLNPMDSTQFTAQLATFSQLEQLTKIAESMEALDRLEQAFTQSQMVSYLGKDVTMSSDMVPVAEGNIGRVSFELGGRANVQALVLDMDGSVVADVDLGELEAGYQEFQWDGKDLAGQSVDDGLYRVSLLATNSQGDTVEISNQLTTARVTGYQKDSDGTSYLLLGDAALESSQVLAVEEPRSAEAQAGFTEEDSGTLDSILETLGTVGGLLAAII